MQLRRKVSGWKYDLKNKTNLSQTWGLGWSCSWGWHGKAPKIEEDLKNKDDLKSEDIIKNKNDLKNEDNLKTRNENDLKN